MTPAWQPALLFVFALLLLVVGHIVRLARWSILMRQIGRPRLGEGFLALSLGYVLDAVLPLQFGEIARGVCYAKRIGVDLAFVLATIVVERTLDLIAVGVITVACIEAGVFTTDSVIGEVGLGFGVGGLVVLVVLATSRLAAFRRGAWVVTSVFNPTIRLTLLHVLWSTLEVFREARAKWFRIAVQSVVMWALYLASFAILALALTAGFEQVYRASLGSPLLPKIVPLIRQGGPAALGLIVYSFAPFLLFLVYAAAKRQFGVSIWGAVSWIADPKLYTGGAPRSASRFVEFQHYTDFLDRRFQGATGLVADFEENAIRDIVVQRMLRGGSDALTVMVQLRDQLCIRKYATGPAAKKLEAQCVWLQDHAGALPTVRVLESRRDDGRFRYDMEYSTTSRDLFDMVHMSGVRTSGALLADVMGTMGSLHARTRARDADDMCVTRYAQDKVTANLKAIKAAYPPFFARDTIAVNGSTVSIKLLDRFADARFMTDRLRRRETATIHGDLTIENILTDPARPGGWFLIDPNIGNIFESPLLDHAKLLQSLHLGYESLNRDLSCHYNERSLEFPNTRSAQYAELYDSTTGWLRDNLGEEGLRETRLHEIVHYFRLTPYKFRKTTDAGLVFLGCLCLLANQYVDEYETC